MKNAQCAHVCDDYAIANEQFCALSLSENTLSYSTAQKFLARFI